MTAQSTLGDPIVGTTLVGTYAIQRLVGEGGMGTVYEALHLRLNKRVAVKIMANALARSAEGLARFRREAEVTSAIGHPHIVQVMDFAIAETGEPFFVMEFLDGEDLEQRMQRNGRLSCFQTLHVVKQVASALAAAHAKGVVHRDLKPANIYLLNVPGEADFVKVLDFGVSKVRAAATKLTAGARLMGTPKYMSREQAQGLADEVDDRADQWALACIAWEALLGRAPFVGDDDLSVLYQVVYEAPTSLSTRTLPPQVDRVLRRALAKDRRERFPNITEFARAFERAIVGRATESSGKGRRGRTWLGSGLRPPPTLRLALSTEIATRENRQRPEMILPAFGAAEQTVSKPSRNRWLWPLATMVAASVLSGASPLQQAVPASPADDGAVSKASACPPLAFPEAKAPLGSPSAPSLATPWTSDEATKATAAEATPVSNVALGERERNLSSTRSLIVPAKPTLSSGTRRAGRQPTREHTMGEFKAPAATPKAVDRGDGAATKAKLIREL